MDTLNIKKHKINLEHEPRGNILDINGRTSDNFS